LEEEGEEEEDGRRQVIWSRKALERGAGEKKRVGSSKD